MSDLSQERKSETTQVRTGVELEYRAVSVPAVIALVLGLLSVLAFATRIFWVLPVAACLAALYAIRRIKSAPSEWTGLRLAYAGLALGAGFLVLAVSSDFVTRALIKLHGKAISDRFVKRLEQGDVEGAFWLAVDKSRRKLALDGKLAKEDEDRLFQMYAEFYREVHPKLAMYGRTVKFTFDKFLNVDTIYGSQMAEMLYRVSAGGEKHTLYVRALGYRSPGHFWKRDWIIASFQFQ